MIKMKALTAFEDQDGDFALGEEFLVNEERCRVLVAEQKAERIGFQVAAPVAAEASPQPVLTAESVEALTRGALQFGAAPRPGAGA